MQMPREQARPTADHAVEEAASRQPWNRKSLLLGLRILVALTSVVVLVLMLRGDLRDNLGAFRRLGAVALGVGVLQSIFDLVGGGVRLWLVARAFGSRVGAGACIRANGAGVLVGGLTPSQTGGGPAQIFVLARSGVGAPVALVSSFLAYICTIVVLLGFGVLMAWHGPPRALGDGTGTFLRIGAGLLGSFLLLFLMALPKPGLYHAAIQRLGSSVPWLKHRVRVSRFLADLGRTLDSSSQLLRQVSARGAVWLLGGVVMTLVVYCNKFLIAYFLVQAMGIPADPLEVIFLQWVVYLVLYFAPTPGASGLAELSSVSIMEAVVPLDHSVAFVVAWRMFSLYVPMVLAGVLLLRRSSGTVACDRKPIRVVAGADTCHTMS